MYWVHFYCLLLASKWTHEPSLQDQLKVEMIDIGLKFRNNSMKIEDHNNVFISFLLNGLCLFDLIFKTIYT